MRLLSAKDSRQAPIAASAFKPRLCIIPASGFYEWTGALGSKTPHYMGAATHPETGEPLTSTAIVVGPANGWMSRFHDRMQGVALVLEARGYRVAEADCGAAALDYLDAPHTVDALITDVEMKGTGGAELVREVRHRPPVSRC